MHRSLRLLVLSVAVVALLGLASVPVSAQSAKATAAVDETIAIGVTAGPVDLTNQAAVNALAWTTILAQTIHIAQQKDMFIDCSLECGNYTLTRVKSSGGTVDTETADAGVRVRVVINPATPGTGSGPGANGRFATPDQGLVLTQSGVNIGKPDGLSAVGAGVSYCRRIQQLTAKFAGIVECVDGTCTLTDEELELLLSTLDASAFNFIVDDLDQGTHLLEVQAVGITSASSADASSSAFVGAGSVTIEEVRMVKDEQVNF